MTRITEILRKAGGNTRNPNVTLRKFNNYLPSNRNRRIVSTPVLANKVSTKSDPASKEAKCVEDMQQLMGCWKLHDFKENTCLEELAKYGKCVKEAKAASDELRRFSASESLGDGDKLNPKQANKLLRMYPRAPYNIVLTQGDGHKTKVPKIFHEYPEERKKQKVFKPYQK